MALCQVRIRLCSLGLLAALAGLPLLPSLLPACLPVPLLVSMMNNNSISPLSSAPANALGLRRGICDDHTSYLGETNGGHAAYLPACLREVACAIAVAAPNALRLCMCICAARGLRTRSVRSSEDSPLLYP